MAPQPAPPVQRRRITYIPLRRESQYLNAELRQKSFHMGGGVLNYGSYVDEGGRRTSLRIGLQKAARSNGR
jgi:hypothetical protein